MNDDNVSRQVPPNVQKSCITILGSLVSVSNRLKDVTIQVNELNMPWVVEGGHSKSFSFSDVKIWLKNLFIRLVNAMNHQTEENTETHCMLLDALCALTLDELLSSER